jgi:surface antigen
VKSTESIDLVLIFFCHFCIWSTFSFFLFGKLELISTQEGSVLGHVALVEEMMPEGTLTIRRDNMAAFVTKICRMVYIRSKLYGGHETSLTVVSAKMESSST